MSFADELKKILKEREERAEASRRTRVVALMSDQMKETFRANAEGGHKFITLSADWTPSEMAEVAQFWRQQGMQVTVERSEAEGPKTPWSKAQKHLKVSWDV